MDKLGIEDTGAFFPHTVTFHASCHGLRSLQLGDKPERLLRNVRGLKLVELPESDQCCGFWRPLRDQELGSFPPPCSRTSTQAILSTGR